MIQMESILKVADNSGAKTVKCIQTVKTSKFRSARLGDMICTSVQQVKHNKKVKKGSVNYALIIRTKYGYHSNNGTKIRFTQNECILLNSRSLKQPVGTRIFGTIPRELKYLDFYKSIFVGINSL